jgi:response regulator RpfG family c-di-GMP phosphodiesterase
VLVVEDEDEVRSAIVRFLSRSGYAPLEAASGQAALEQLSLRQAAAALCDIRMPGMSGVELLPRLIARDPDLAVLMMTAVDDPRNAILCLKNGAVDYLIKPVDMEELALALSYALRKRELEIERRSLEEWLAREVAVKTREIEEQNRRAQTLSLSVLAALVRALEPRDGRGRSHSVRVAGLAAHVAARLALPGELVDATTTAARLHDVGQLAMREEVLREAAAGEASELVGARGAAEAGQRILGPLTHHREVAAIVRHQHERWDGRGHPEGLRGEAIPIGSRILAAANLYDELAAGSAEHAALTPAQALENLRGLAGTMLDPAVLEALEGVVAERG